MISSVNISSKLIKAKPSSSYINREISQVLFNLRVLELSENKNIPLLERLKFLSIFSSNMDEFFEIRVSGLIARLEAGSTEPTIDGLRPDQILTRLRKIIPSLVERQYNILNKELLPELAANGIIFLKRAQWSANLRKKLNRYFTSHVKPILTPVGLDPAHPFPKILNKSLNFAIELEGKNILGKKINLALLQAPRALPRFLKVSDEKDEEIKFVFLSSIIHEFANGLFNGMKVSGFYQFRVTRNSDLYLDQEEIKDVRDALESEMPTRQYGDAVRLEVSKNTPASIINYLLNHFELTIDKLYEVDGPVNLARLQDVPEQIQQTKFKYKPFRQKTYLNTEKDVFQQIKAEDILIHHPYDSFENYLNYIHAALKDPNVLAIKQTIYRVAGNSKLMQLLIDCAKRSIAVTVVVELLARFDEEANINWAEQLEAYGVNVVYGVVGYKTHAKMSMIIRKEGRRLARYVHLGTGNYHEKTSKLYSDFGIFTANYQLCNEVDDVFNQITSMGKPKKHKLILQSPFSLHSGLIKHIDDSIKNKNKKNNFIIFKANSLIEPKIIEKLYEASSSGVKIYLIIRGACALRPAVNDLSSNIKVISIIGRFLEHHRCYYFSSSDTLYLSSADCMERNFYRRYELAFPILDKKIRNYLVSILNMFLKDNVNSYKLLSNGKYLKIKDKKKPFSIHDYLLNF